MSNPLQLDLPTPDATAAFGRRLADLLFPGAVVALIGPLGAGKTQLGLPIYHFDAYRLRSAAEFFDLGAHEYFEGKGVCLVEWADRALACLPAEHLRVTLTSTGETSRRCTIEGYGERYTALVARLAGGA